MGTITKTHYKGTSGYIQESLSLNAVELEVNVTNTELDVNCTNTELDVNVANTSLDVNVANTSLDVNVANTSLDVNVLSTNLVQDQVTNSNALLVIDTSHYENHQGIHYIVTDYDADIDIATPKYYYFKASATYHPHLTFATSYNAACILYVYENPTISQADGDTGSSLTAINQNRGSANTSSSLVKKDTVLGTGGNDGTLLYTQYMGTSGSVPSQRGGGAAQTHEFILKQDEEYLFKIVTIANDNKGTLELTWYEVGQE